MSVHRHHFSPPVKSKKAKKLRNPAPEPELEPEEDAASENVEADEEDVQAGGKGGVDDGADGSGDDADIVSDDGLDQDGALLPPSTESDSFDDLNLSDQTRKAITEMGFTKMTEIQRRVRLSGSFSHEALAYRHVDRQSPLFSRVKTR